MTTIDHTGRPVPKSELANLMASYEHDTRHEKKADFIPTPQEIEVGKRKVQDGWSEREERARAGANRPKPWTPPSAREPGFETDE